MFNSEKPYNELPLLFPDENQWKNIALLEQLNKSNKILAELKGRISNIPNPNIFISTLTLQEAKESSEIENVLTTNDKLFKAFTTNKVDDNATKEVLFYGLAISKSVDKLRINKKLDMNLIIDIYRDIKQENDGIRDKEVFLANRYGKIYTPPCCFDIISKKLNNWLDRANEINNLDPLIKIAMLHYQFEAIHPFKDGNGRTGRVLNALLLIKYDLIQEPVLYLSKFINENKNEYYKLLKEVTENKNWSNWILFFLKTIEDSATELIVKINDIINLFNETKDIIKQNAPKIYSFELVEVLFIQVYCKYSTLEENGIASRNTASKYLNTLTDLGILEKIKSGNELIYKNIKLFELLKD